MQEEVENKSVALSIKATKLTANVLKAALRKALAEMEKAKKNPKTLNVGRVMTPTLALVVDREAAISEFKKEKFYTVVLDCGKFTASSERCENRKAADHLSAACSTQAAVVKQVEKKQKSAQPPKLYDLTSLQRDGNRLFGYTAQQVLDYAQTLYEKKLLTYPRTDSNYLTEDMKDTIPGQKPER